MTEAIHDEIVSFEHPPVVEVVCGVQFSQLPLQSAHFGRFWDQVRGDFPTTRDAAPLPPAIEPPPGGGPVFTSIAWNDLPDLRRVFLINAERGRLLQLQGDRFHFNWQKLPDGSSYPRFGEVAGEFLRRWEEFNSFLRDEQLPSPAVVQAELSYINQILLGDGPGAGTRAAVFPWFSPANQAVASESDFEAAIHYEVPSFGGRLHMTVRSARRVRDNAPVAMMELTARGAVDERGLGVWLASARSSIVRSFAELTGPIAHRQWGRTR